MKHHIGQGDLAGFPKGFPEQGVDLAATLVRREEVGGVDVLQRDLVAGDKRDDLDGLGRFGVGRADFFFAQHHVAAFLERNAFDDVVLCHFLASGLVDALVTHRIHAALVQPVKVNALRGGGRNQ